MRGQKRCLAYICSVLSVFFLLYTSAIVSSSIAAEDAGSASLIVQGCGPFSEYVNSKHVFVDYVFIQATCAAKIDTIIDLSDKICPPYNYNNVQAQKLVVEYIEQLPARLHERFTRVALEALILAWPCSR